MGTVSPLKSESIFPKTLIIGVSLFMERFAYYGLRTVLILFLLEQLAFDDGKAVAYYGIFTGAGYFLGLLIGPMVDFLIGKRVALIISGPLFFLGGLLLFPLEMPVAGLTLVALAASLSRVGIYGSLSSIFNKRDNRRDVAFGSMYVAINVGALLASILVPFVSSEWGFTAAFGVVGPVALLSSLGIALTYNWFPQRMWFRAELHAQSPSKPLDAGEMNQRAMPNESRSNVLPRMERVLAPLTISLVIIFSIFFWAAFETHSLELSIAQAKLDMPSYSFAINPTTILLFLPVVLVALYFINKGKMKLHYLIMFGICALASGIGYICFDLQAEWSIATVLSSYFIFSLVECFFAPFMYSYILRLVPDYLSGTMIGVYAASFAASNYVGGWLTNFESPGIVLGVVCAVFGVGFLLLRFLGLRKDSF